MMRHADDLPDSPEDTEADLWFLPGPAEDETTPAPVSADVTDWIAAEASCAARLAHVAGRLGALDDRLGRGPAGWRHRLALIEAADLGWLAGARIGHERLALWMALRLAGTQTDIGALAQLGWAVRRLTDGPGPGAGLAAFLDRQDPGTLPPDSEPLADRAEAWVSLMAGGGMLHPISRACMGYHLWDRAGLGRPGDRIEAAVTAARIAAGAGQGAVFAPLVMGGAGGALSPGGTARIRLERWLGGMERACRTALRHLDDVEAWATRAAALTAPLSGRTPPALCRALADWPLLSAPMAEAMTGASRAAVQRNLAWMEDRGLVREVTGQGRFRMWRIAI